MNKTQKQKGLSIQNDIRQVLYHDWDPLNVAGEAPEDEYDGYIGGIYNLLKGSRSSTEIITYLQEIEDIQMGVGPVKSECLEPVAIKLLSLQV